MLGVSIVAISLLLHQQLMTFSMLVPSTAHATASTGAEAQPQAADADRRHGDLGTGRLHNEDGVLSVDDSQILAVASQLQNEDQLKPGISDEDLLSAVHGPHQSRLRQMLLKALLNDRKQQQSAAEGTWLDGLAKRRAHIFVGKRSDMGAWTAPHHSLDIRPETSEMMASGKFLDDVLDDVVNDKRSRMFVGKRPASVSVVDGDDSAAIDGWMPPALGGRYGEDLPTANKRPRMFVGKKHAPVFVGKR